MDYEYEFSGLNPYANDELEKIKLDFDPSMEYKLDRLDFDNNSEGNNNQENCRIGSPVFKDEGNQIFNFRSLAGSIKLSNSDDSESKLNLQSIQEDCPDTKIIIKLDGLDEHWVDNLNIQNNSNQVKEPSESSYNEEVKQSPAPASKKRKKRKVQVINAHNQKRNDVVLKSILRSMRRFLCKQFLTKTRFKKNEKQHKVRMEKLVLATNQLINQLEFPVEATNFSFYYLALAYPSELKKLLQDAEKENIDKLIIINQASSVITLIESVMNRFSKKVFKDFMEVPEISVLVQHFLDSNSDDLEGIEGFEPWIAMLDERSKEIISKYAEDPKAFSDNKYWIKETLFIFN
jgi:hypothetical protein